MEVIVISVVCESRIEGAFTGWKGHSRYKLVNGQIWEQAHYFYHYHYAYRPEITIEQGQNGYEMHVLGDDFIAIVKRVYSA